MPLHGIRAALRDGTYDLHVVLDRQVGQLDTRAAYADYLRGSYAFRAAVEPALQETGPGQSWQPMVLTDALAQDLAQLGMSRPRPIPLPRLTGPSALAGAFYVLEGSAIGATLIFRRAMALGFAAGSGATHLALQTGQRSRWKAFLDWLDATNCSAPEAIAGARAVFRAALVAHGAGSAGGACAMSGQRSVQ